MDLVAHPAVHREATRLVNRYGPLFKLRIMMFHVRGLRARCAARTGLGLAEPLP
jgi:hypothetical protein